MTFVVYQGVNEIIITTGEKEKSMLAKYSDRNFEEDYDRDEFDDVTLIEISSLVKLGMVI